MFVDRVLSGMRPTGALHLGHFHGVLKNWVRLQHEFECLFFVADWHALTTHYDTPDIIEQNTWDMAIDWLAAGVDPSQATLFIQSRVPQHAEIRWHLGAVLAGVGQFDLALQAVEIALRLNPDLEENAEVSELRAKLQKQIGKSP